MLITLRATFVLHTLQRMVSRRLPNAGLGLALVHQLFPYVWLWRVLRNVL